MKILLVFSGSFCRRRSIKFKQYVPPLGISQLSSYLKEHGYKTRLIDLRLLSGWDEFNVQLKKFRPDVVGFSILTSEMDMAEAGIKNVHSVFPGTKIIVGGPHVTVLPRDVIKIPEVFAGVIGEGELTLLDLLNTIQISRPLSTVPGIVYKQKNKVVITPPRPFIKNLDDLPFADRNIYSSEGWNSAAYQLFFPMRYPIANIIVSRGCPGMCTMCQPTLDKIFGRPGRFRSPENVIAEIKLLISTKHINSVIFWDDTLTANFTWLNDFCLLLSKNKIHIDWWCYSRVNNVNSSVLEKMKQAGCKMLCFGIESGSQRVLNEVMHKGTTVRQNIDTINLCHTHGLLANANVMIGSPTETLAEIKMTDKLLTSTKPDIVWASVTSPLPGTYLGEQAKKEGLIVNSKWSEFTRGQIGRAKIKSKLSKHDIILYQTKWHQTRFRPDFITKPYYFSACLRLAECHLKQHHPERIISDFIFGPIIETGRRLYWRYFFSHP